MKFGISDCEVPHVPAFKHRVRIYSVLTEKAKKKRKRIWATLIFRLCDSSEFKYKCWGMLSVCVCVYTLVWLKFKIKRGWIIIIIIKL